MTRRGECQRCSDCAHLKDDEEVKGVCFCELKDECEFQEDEEC